MQGRAAGLGARGKSGTRVSIIVIPVRWPRVCVGLHTLGPELRRVCAEQAACEQNFSKNHSDQVENPFSDVTAGERERDRKRERGAVGADGVGRRERNAEGPGRAG